MKQIFEVGKRQMILALALAMLLLASGCSITGYAIVSNENQKTENNQPTKQPSPSVQEDKETISTKIAEVFKKNNPPTVMITEPDNGETVSGDSVTIWWRAEDPEREEVTIALEYMQGDGNWVLITRDEPNDRSYEWDISGLPGGNYKLRIYAYDGKKDTIDTKSINIQR